MKPPIEPICWALLKHLHTQFCQVVDGVGEGCGGVGVGVGVGAGGGGDSVVNDDVDAFDGVLSSSLKMNVLLFWVKHVLNEIGGGSDDARTLRFSDGDGDGLRSLWFGE